MENVKKFFKTGCLLPAGIFIFGFILYVVYQSWIAPWAATLGKCGDGCLYTATNGRNSVSVIGYSADGSRLLTRGGKLLIHDTETGDKITEVDFDDAGYRVTISEDGQQIIAKKRDVLEFYNWDGELIRYWTHAEGSSMADMAQVPMVNGFAVTDKAGISIWKNSDDSLLVRLYEGERLGDLTTSLENDRLAAFDSINEQVLVWDLQSLDDAFVINSVDADKIQLSADGSVLFVAAQEGIYVRDAENGDLLAVLETEEAYATAFDFNTEEELVAIGYDTGDVVVWDYEQDVILIQIPHSHVPGTLTISPDGKQLAVGIRKSVEVSGGELIFNRSRIGIRNRNNPIFRLRQSDNRIDVTPGYAIVWSLVLPESD